MNVVPACNCIFEWWTLHSPSSNCAASPSLVLDATDPSDTEIMCALNMRQAIFMSQGGHQASIPPHILQVFPRNMAHHLMQWWWQMETISSQLHAITCIPRYHSSHPSYIATSIKPIPHYFNLYGREAGSLSQLDTIQPPNSSKYSQIKTLKCNWTTNEKWTIVDYSTPRN